MIKIYNFFATLSELFLYYFLNFFKAKRCNLILKASKLKYPSSRKDREPEIDLLIEKWTRELSPYDAMERLQNAGVPSGVFLNPRGLADDPHLKERRFLSPVIYKDGVERMMPVLPWRFVSGPEPRLESAPLMGEHNSYIFEEILGISSEEVSKLIETQVIY